MANCKAIQRRAFARRKRPENYRKCSIPMKWRVWLKCQPIPSWENAIAPCWNYFIPPVCVYRNYAACIGVIWIWRMDSFACSAKVPRCASYRSESMPAKRSKTGGWTLPANWMRRFSRDEMAVLHRGQYSCASNNWRKAKAFGSACIRI